MNRPEPLTPEERELARLLGRTAPSAPSAALDDAVLAAARAAVQPAGGAAAVGAAPTTAAGAPRAVRRLRSRLPAAFGLAASLVFAVGIAWQLKPDSPPPALPGVAVEAAVDAAAAPMPAARSDAGTAMARVAQAPAAAAEIAAEPIAKPAPLPPPPAASVTQEMAAAAPPPPAPAMAAPAPQSKAMLADTQSELDSVADTSPREADSRERAKAASAPALAARSAGAAGIMRRPATAQDDASGALSARALDTAVEADAALPRTQWIKRIRERRDAGDVDTARASLERYLEHYPEVRVPRDLRQLLDP
jgi:hypothetical protein